MRNIFSIFLVTFILILISQSDSLAGGLAMPNGELQVVQTETQAAIIFDGKTETLFDSFTFTINPIIATDFAWLIAVPTKPEVELIKDDLFPKLESLTKKTVTKDTLWKKILFFDIEEEKYTSQDIFTRPLDFRLFDVIEPPNQIEKLESWLSYSGFLIPKTGRSLIEEYQNKGWYFIVAEVNAVHMQMNASESLTIPGVHTFPIKITFPTDEIIYPLKLITIQPDYDSEKINLGYQYGLKSEDVLGEHDEQVDDMLAQPSKNHFPQVPHDYAYLKSSLYVFSNKRVDAPKFTTIYSNQIKKADAPFTDLTDQKYFDLPTEKMYLTKLISYTPFLQLEDISIKDAPNNSKVNTYTSLPLQYIKVLALPFIFLLIKRRKRHETN